MEEDKGAGGGLGGAIGLASSFGIDIGGTGGGGAFASSNLAELMKSRLIVEKVLLSKIDSNNQTLIEYYLAINKLRDSWKGNSKLENLHFDFNRLNFKLEHDSVLKEVYKKLISKENLNIIQKDKKITILTIEVNSQNELFSKLFCEGLARETSNFYIETKSKKSKINVEVLQRQVDSLRYELNTSINGAAKEIDNVYNLNPAFNIKGTGSKKRQIDVQTNANLLSNLLVQLEISKISLRKETPLIQLIDKPTLPLEKDKIGRFKASILFAFLGVFISIIILVSTRFLRQVLL